MIKLHERAWSVLFAVSVGILMLTVLMMRSDPMPSWVLIVYPFVGALLALAASRTSPSAEQMTWIETGTIAAAAIVVLACLVNMLLLDMLVRQVRSDEMLGAGQARELVFFAAPAAAVLLWLALQRRLSRLRAHAIGRERQAQTVPAE